MALSRRLAWPKPPAILIAMLMVATILGAGAASGVAGNGVSAGGAAPPDEDQILKAAAGRLARQYHADREAFRSLGLTALRAGRNDATVAHFLRLSWIARLNRGLERYGAMVEATDTDRLALGVAGVQRYSELIHSRLLHDGPGKLVVVSVEAQQLVAYDHGRLVVDTLVTTGRPGLATDIGAMRVWKKDSPWVMKSPWPKESPNWYPDTQVQTVAWFTKNGEGLHDASWQPAGTYGPGSQNGPYASHGCIHVPPAAQAILFTWVVIGTPVVVIPGDGSPLGAQVARQSVDAMGNPIAGVRGD